MPNRNAGLPNCEIALEDSPKPPASANSADRDSFPAEIDLAEKEEVTTPDCKRDESCNRGEVSSFQSADETSLILRMTRAGTTSPARSCFWLNCSSRLSVVLGCGAGVFANTGLRIMAVVVVRVHPRADAGHQDERNQEDESQQLPDILARFSIGIDEVLEFRLLEPFATLGNCVSVITFHHCRATVSIHETKLSHRISKPNRQSHLPPGEPILNGICFAVESSARSPENGILRNEKMAIPDTDYSPQHGQTSGTNTVNVAEYAVDS
jgi:hypothetical protein